MIINHYSLIKNNILNLICLFIIFFFHSTMLQEISQIFKIKIHDEKLASIIQNMQLSQTQSQQLIENLTHRITHLENNSYQTNSLLQNIKIQVNQSNREQQRKFDFFTHEIKQMGVHLCEEIEEKIKEKRQGIVDSVTQHVVSVTNIKLQEVEQQILELRAKMGTIEDYKEKGDWVLSLMKNSSFLDFMHVLIDRQTEGKVKSCKKKIKEISQNEVQKQEEKTEFYNNLKKDITTTQDALKKLKLKVSKNLDKEKKNSYDVSTLQYAALSAKLNAIEKKIEHSPEQNLQEKIIYPSQEKGRRHGSLKNSASLEPLELEQKNILTKVDMLSELLGKRVTEMEKKMRNLFEENKELKELIIGLFESEKKQKTQYEYLKLQLRRINEVNFENDQLKLVYQAMKKLEERLQEKIQEKCQKKQLKAMRQGIENKVAIIKEAVFSKANKDEIKKAFIFLEDKIREIVMILVDIQTKSNDVAGKKQLFQCLSCNNSFFDEKSKKRIHYSPPTAIKRCNTARTLRHITLKKQNKTLKAQK